MTLYDQYLTQAMEAGATGYLLKDIKREELVQAIRRVSGGQIVTSESIKSKDYFDIDEREETKDEDDFGTMLEELQLVVPPHVEARQVMRLASRVEEALESRVLQMVGAWQEGTVMTIILPKAKTLAGILCIFSNMPGIETAAENPLTDMVDPQLLKKAEAIPRLNNRTRKTIFLTLEKS